MSLGGGGRSARAGRPRSLCVISIRFCDDRSTSGFSVDRRQPATRTSPRAFGRRSVWLVDPAPAARARPRPRSRRGRAPFFSCSTGTTATAPRVAGELEHPRLVVPDAVRDSPSRSSPWSARALARDGAWSAGRSRRADHRRAIGANQYSRRRRIGPAFTCCSGSRRRATRSAGSSPEHLLVGHGEGVPRADATTALDQALDHAPDQPLPAGSRRASRAQARFAAARGTCAATGEAVGPAP